MHGEAREIVSERALDAMTDTMTHRGPNDRGTHRGPGIALGVRRLSIVDVEGDISLFSTKTTRSSRFRTASCTTTSRFATT